MNMRKIAEYTNKIVPIMLIIGIACIFVPMSAAMYASATYSDLNDITFRFKVAKIKGYQPHYDWDKEVWTRWITIKSPEYNDGTWANEKVIPHVKIEIQTPSDAKLVYEGLIRNGQYKIWIWKLKFSIGITVDPAYSDGAALGAKSDGLAYVDLRITVLGAKGYMIKEAKCFNIKWQGVTSDDLFAKHQITNKEYILDYQQHSKAFTPLVGSNIEIYDPYGKKYDYPESKEDIENYLSFPKELRFYAKVSPTVVKDWFTKNVEATSTTLFWECYLWIASFSKYDPVAGDYTKPDDPTTGLDVDWWSKIWTRFGWLIIIGIIIIIIVLIIKIIGAIFSFKK